MFGEIIVMIKMDTGRRVLEVKKEILGIGKSEPAKDKETLWKSYLFYLLSSTRSSAKKASSGK